VSRKSLVAAWRDAVRDSALSTTAKVVAYTLSTYLNGRGTAFPSRQLLAEGSSLGVGLRSVDAALRELEMAGYLDIERSRGRSSHTYQAIVPSTAHPLRRSEFATAQEKALNGARGASNRARGAHEDVEDVGSGALDAVAADSGTACTLIEDECGRCGQRLPLPDDIHCAGCLAELATERASG
jgi:hypothetical protein